MKAWLMDLLACPTCGNDLRLEASEIGEHGGVKKGVLRSACGQSFPVIDYIPRFVKTELYAQSFGIEWNLFPRTQLDRPNDGDEKRIIYNLKEVRLGEESRESFILKTGIELSDLEGKLVLDAGCGMGRFSDVCAKAGARVVGVDLSQAVEAAFDNVGFEPNVSIVQADIFNLPFKKGRFDIVFSIGVLHHTPDTRRAFLSLVPFLKPGGRISIWVYAKPKWRGSVIPYRYVFSDMIRLVTTRLSEEKLLKLCEMRARIAPIGDIPIVGKVLRLVCPTSNHPNFEWRVMDTLDWYSPKYQWKHTEEEVVAWFREAGLTNIEALQVPVSVTAQKPGC